MGIIMLNKLKKISWRLFFADLFARIIFSFATGMVIEINFAGMTVWMSIKSRCTNLPIVMIFARPYGIYRDWAVGIVGVKKKQFILYGLTNMLTYATFYIPQYALVLWLYGATWAQIKIASAMVAVLSPVLGWGYGIWLDFVRVKIFGIKPQVKKE
jgi:hypothetical protein